MFGQIFRQWAWDCYDAMGRLLVLNIVLFLLLLGVGSAVLFALGPLPLSQLSPGTAILVLVAAGTVAGWIAGVLWFAPILHFGHLSSNDRDPSLRDALRGFRVAGPPVAKLLLLVLPVMGILLLGLWFYFLSGILADSYRYLALLAGGLTFWALMILVTATGYALPLVARRERGTLGSLRLSALAVIKYPLLSFGCLLFLSSIWVISVGVKMVGVMLVAFSLTAMFLNSLHDVLWHVEDVGDRARQRGEEPKRATSWREVEPEDEETEEQRLHRKRYERTLRDIIRPWEN